MKIIIIFVLATLCLVSASRDIPVSYKTVVSDVDPSDKQYHLYTVSPSDDEDVAHVADGNEPVFKVFQGCSYWLDDPFAWNNISSDKQAAWEKLGFDQTHWDDWSEENCDEVSTVCDGWSGMSEEQTLAARTLGFAEEDWDSCFKCEACNADLRRETLIQQKAASEAAAKAAAKKAEVDESLDHHEVVPVQHSKLVVGGVEVDADTIRKRSHSYKVHQQELEAEAKAKLADQTQALLQAQASSSQKHKKLTSSGNAVRDRLKARAAARATARVQAEAHAELMAERQAANEARAQIHAEQDAELNAALADEIKAENDLVAAETAAHKNHDDMSLAQAEQDARQQVDAAHAVVTEVENKIDVARKAEAEETAARVQEDRANKEQHEADLADAAAEQQSTEEAKIIASHELALKAAGKLKSSSSSSSSSATDMGDTTNACIYWGGDDSPDAWSDMTSNQKVHWTKLGYSETLWDDYSDDNCDQITTICSEWSDLDDDQQSAAELLGYSSTTWDNCDRSCESAC